MHAMHASLSGTPVPGGGGGFCVRVLRHGHWSPPAPGANSPALQGDALERCSFRLVLGRTISGVRWSRSPFVALLPGLTRE